jgi:CheY-like chemotaxis protein
MTSHLSVRNRPSQTLGPSGSVGRDPPGGRPGGDAGGTDPARPTPVVLAADDDPLVLRTLETILRHWGVRAHVAPDGARAVELFRRHRAEVTLVLLDVRMPGLDGPGALDVLRGIDPQVYCWFVTGDATPYTVSGLLARGAAGVLGKPYDLPTLRAILDGSARPARIRPG